MGRPLLGATRTSRDLLPRRAPRRGPRVPRRHAHQRRRRQRRHLPQAARDHARRPTASSSWSRPATSRRRRRCSTASTATSAAPGDTRPRDGRSPLRGRALRRPAQPGGRAVAPRRVRQRRSDATATFILGGQVGAEAPDVLLVYPEGNYIRASDERPFLQIGESKYGKFLLEVGIHARGRHGHRGQGGAELDDQHRAREPLGGTALRHRDLPHRARTGSRSSASTPTPPRCCAFSASGASACWSRSASLPAISPADFVALDLED